MELSSTRELRRNAQLDKMTGKKADAPEAPAKTQISQPREPADKLSLSRQALAYVEEQSRLAWNLEEGQDKKHSVIQGYLDAMETQKKQLDSMEEKLDMMDKCQKIAAAIMRGDRVPPEDLRYLMEHDKEGYKLAVALRREKKDPKKVESVLDEEDRNGGKTEEADSGGETPSVEAAGASEGGGSAGSSTDT